MATLLERIILPNGQKWGLFADGGIEPEDIDAFVAVPVEYIGALSAEQIGTIVQSLVLDAEAVRLKCAIGHMFSTRDHALERIEMLLAKGRDLGVKAEASDDQHAFYDVPKFMGGPWRPGWGLTAIQELYEEITGKLRKEYFDLLRKRELDRKKRLTPKESQRIEFIIDKLHGCKVCRLIDGNHTDACRAVPNAKHDPKKVKDRRGHIYVLQTPDGSVKIGKTVNVTARVADLGIASPVPLELIHTIECADHHKVETALHMKFADRRIRGEWFLLTAEDIAWLKTLAMLPADWSVK